MANQSPSSDNPLADFGANEWLVEDMRERYDADPSSVDVAWREFFAAQGNNAGPMTSAEPAASNATPVKTEAKPTPEQAEKKAEPKAAEKKAEPSRPKAEVLGAEVLGAEACRPEACRRRGQPAEDRR